MPFLDDSSQWPRVMEEGPEPPVTAPGPVPAPAPDKTRHILSLLAPFLVGGLAKLGGGDALSVGGAMSGAEQANRQWETQQRQDALLQQQQAYRQAQEQRQQQAVETQQQRLKTAFIQDAFSKAGQIADPLEHQQFVENYDQTGVSELGLRPGWLKTRAVFSDSKRAASVRKEADAILSKLEANDTLGEALKTPGGWDMAVEFPALKRSVTLKELAQYAGRPQTADGTYLLATKPERRVWTTTRDKTGKMVRRFVTESEAASQDWEQEPVAKVNVNAGPAAGQGWGDEVTGARPTGPNANRVDRRTGLTPNALYQNGVAYALQGVMPTLGMGSQGQVTNARMAVQNVAGALAAQAGVDLPTLRAEYKANSAALGRLVPYYTMTEAATETARKNIGLALSLSEKVARTGSPLVNRYLLWAKGEKLTGDPNYTRFETAIYTAAREYAKVTSGAALSATGLTDTAAKEAGRILNSAQTPDAFAAAVETMQRDMDNVATSYFGQINKVSDVIGRFLAASSANPHLAAPEPPAPQSQAGSPAEEVAALLKSEPPGTYTLTDGSVWMKNPDGGLRKVR